MFSYPISTHGAVEVANYAALPAVGESGVIYITIDDNKTYRWTGSGYVLIGGTGNATQSITQAQAAIGISLTNNIVTISDALTADLQIGTLTNIPIGDFMITWTQDATGGRNLIMPNGITYYGGVGTEEQYGIFKGNGTNYYQVK